MNHHIDKNVILILLSVTLVSLITIGFKYAKYDPCDIVNFDAKADQFRAGEIIRFKDYSENAQTYVWDFGDSTVVRKDPNPFHTYEVPGKYLVTLTVNGKCDFSKEIVIQKKIPIIDSTRIANFEIPSTIKVGELLSVKDLTKEATSWEWRFGETLEVNSTYQNPTYSYQKEGLKTITLIVNGDPRYSTSKQIQVLPKIELKKPLERKKIEHTPDPIMTATPLPEAPPELPNSPNISNKPSSNKIKKTPSISRSAFAKKIIAVSEEQASANDFRQYLCDGNLQTNTSVKGKKTTFIELCEKIKGKKIKIKSLELFKNKETNCIEYISIDLSKKLF